MPEIIEVHPTKQCAICDRVGDDMKYLHCECRYLCSDECFEIAFWASKIAWRDHGDVLPNGSKVARVHGVHYIIYPDEEPVLGGFRGHGGAEFVFEFHVDGPRKGEIVRSRNVWCQGQIPERFRSLLPDNARMYNRANL